MNLAGILNWLSEFWACLSNYLSLHKGTIALALFIIAFVFYFRASHKGAYKIAKQFCTLFRLPDNRAKLVLFVFSFIACILPWILLLWFENQAANASANFALLSTSTTLLGALIGAVVLVKLDRITSTEEFLVQLIELLRDAQSGHTLIFIGPSFNIQSIPKSDLYSAFQTELKNCLKRGAKLKLCYLENKIDATKYIDLKNGLTEVQLWTKQQRWIDKCSSEGLIKWTQQVLDWDHWEKRHEYFQGVFSFLRDLRIAGLLISDEFVYPTKLIDGNQFAVFIGILETKDFLIGRFVVNPDAPQQFRVTCDAEYIRSKNKHIGEALENLLAQTLADAVPQPTGETAPP